MNRAQALRLSLLVSIGAIPACGGTVSNSRDNNGDGSSGNAATGQGGSNSKTAGGQGKMLPPGTGGVGVGTGGTINVGTAATGMQLARARSDQRPHQLC